MRPPPPARGRIAPAAASAPPVCAAVLCAAMLCAGLLSAGCAAGPAHRTARILEPDSLAVGGRLGAATLLDEPAATVPFLLPEVDLHYGAAPDVQIGGRIALAALMAELDIRWRFLGTDGDVLHLAAGTEVGWRVIALIGPHANLPLTLALAPADTFAISLSGFAGYRGLEPVDDDIPTDLARLGTRVLTAGGSATVELRFGEVYVAPAAELWFPVRRLAGDPELYEPADPVLSMGLAVGWLRR